jgi:hypothetical protein
MEKEVAAWHWGLTPVIPATQEDHSSKPALGKQFTRPYLKKTPSQKRSGGVAQGVDPEFKSQPPKKKKTR